MKRRSFVKASVIGSTAATVFPAISNAMTDQVKPAVTNYFELRIYTLKDDNQQQLVEHYLQNAAIPALNRTGISNVGVFKDMEPKGQTKIYVLIQYNGLDHFTRVNDSIDKDNELQKDGAAYLNAPASSPAYERIETSLLQAFKTGPKLTVPPKTTRLFELRQYQSPGEAAGKKKIEMFNEQGETAIFQRLGFKPVFWGETIIGPQRPNLTYMLTFDDMAAKAAHWKAFGNDPQWKKISAVPGYADALLINKITSTMLIPTDYSQI